jgi:predicted enzyme related to lactoylglutathione lyase
MNNRVVHFEIQADEPERAMKFYGDVFGWEYKDWGSVTGTPYWGIMTAPMEEGGMPSKEPGINGGLLKRPCPAPKPEQGSNAFICTIQVDDYDATAKKILDAGGIVALPKMALAGMAWQGYFLDTEGNTFGLHQTDKNAK